MAMASSLSCHRKADSLSGAGFAFTAVTQTNKPLHIYPNPSLDCHTLGGVQLTPELIKVPRQLLEELGTGRKVG